MNPTPELLYQTTEDPREALLLLLSICGPLHEADLCRVFPGDAKRTRKYLADLAGWSSIARNQSGAWTFVGWKLPPRRPWPLPALQRPVAFADDLVNAMGSRTSACRSAPSDQGGAATPPYRAPAPTPPAARAPEVSSFRASGAGALASALENSPKLQAKARNELAGLRGPEDVRNLLLKEIGQAIWNHPKWGPQWRHWADHELAAVEWALEELANKRAREHVSSAAGFIANCVRQCLRVVQASEARR